MVAEAVDVAASEVMVLGTRCASMAQRQSFASSYRARTKRHAAGLFPGRSRLDSPCCDQRWPQRRLVSGRTRHHSGRRPCRCASRRSEASSTGRRVRPLARRCQKGDIACTYRATCGGSVPWQRGGDARRRRLCRFRTGTAAERAAGVPREAPPSPPSWRRPLAWPSDSRRCPGTNACTMSTLRAPAHACPPPLARAASALLSPFSLHRLPCLTGRRSQN